MDKNVLDKAVASLDVVVAGRRFRAATATTFEQDIYTMQLLQETGLKDLADSVDVIGEGLTDIGQRVLLTAFASGKLFLLLGAVLEEVGVPWTIEVAKANGTFFSNLRTAEDKQALHGSLVAVILGFFVSGLLSSKTSKMSSLVSLEMQPGSTEQSDVPQS